MYRNWNWYWFIQNGDGEWWSLFGWTTSIDYANQYLSVEAAKGVVQHLFLGDARLLYRVRVNGETHMYEEQEGMAIIAHNNTLTDNAFTP